jgi:alanine racemase
MNYTILQIAGIVGGELTEHNDSGLITRVLLDSRKILQPREALFIAIRGERHDGHQYIEEVYGAGVRNFIVEKSPEENYPGASFVLVKNATLAFQMLAAHHRARVHFPVIGITGSNGKTIVKEWLNTLLSDEYRIVRSPKSFNSQIGVPLSVLNIDESHELGIFEAGISQPGEMEKLARVIQPTIGVFTSIGTAHSENFLSRRQLIGEKLNLFSKTDVIICPDDSDLMQLVLPWMSIKQIVFMPDAWAVRTASHLHHTFVNLPWREKEFPFEIPFTDRASVENVIACIYTMLVMEYVPEEIQNRLARLSPLEMRLQLMDGENDSIIVNDAYSNDLQSLEIALDFLQQHSRNHNKIVVLSDLYQTGLNDQELHGKISSLLLEKQIGVFIGIGKGMMQNSSFYPENARFFESTEAFLKEKESLSFNRAAMLVKGARNFRFERIAAAFQEQTHDTILEINLSAMSQNLNYFRSKLRPGTRIMVMVKAFGYGSGSHEVASLLEYHKVDYLAVAYTDEGVALRKAGISLPIMVMNPERSSLPALIRYKLEPEIYSFRTLENFIHALHTTDAPIPYPVHIKLDTGMHRLGFEEQDMSKLAEIILSRPDLKIASVFTHLAATDESSHDVFTMKQLQKFDRISELVESKTNQRFLRHAMNTGGIERFADSKYEMVRLGIGLYGVSASGRDQAHLSHVSTLKTVISQIRTIPAGDSVGYSRNFVAKKEMRIATIPVGYADGLRRTMSNGVGYVIINGKRAPITGNVCMDMTMVDVTDIDCVEGDAVEIFGDKISLAAFADMNGTIAYEVLTSVSQRVKRVYHQE